MHNVFGISTVWYSKLNEKLSSFLCVIKYLLILGPWEMLFLALMLKEGCCVGYGISCFG